MTFAPPTAPTIWSEGRDVYAEFPKTGDQPTVLRFPLTEAGLSKLLRMIPNIALTPGYISGGANVYDKIVKKKIIIARKTAATRSRPKLSDQGKSALRALIRGVKY